MPKVVIIGAGSWFGSRVSFDILSRPPLAGSTLVLCDIDAAKVKAVVAYVRRAADAWKVPAKIHGATDHRKAMRGADFVITSVAVGGPAYSGHLFANEMNIPRKYGVDQSVGDTIGPGGVFRFLRTAPVQLGFARDMERLCPDALLINYTNPMCMLTWLHSATGVRNVGLCHSVQFTIQELSGYVGLPKDEIDYWVAGINHQAWVLRFRHRGRDAYPLIRKAMETPNIYAKDRVRFEMMKHFGWFVTESSHHNSEYMPYFRRTQKLRDEFRLETRTISTTPRPPNREWAKPDAPIPELERSNEYASGIIEAMTTGSPFRINGNVMNSGLVTNLPEGCCVEVPCMVDQAGVHPCYVGALPPQCAALNRTNVAVQELAVLAAIDHDRDAAFHAVALDPLTAACAGLRQIRAMFDEMWEAEKDFLTYFDK